jgi:hypothetical protein
MTRASQLVVSVAAASLAWLAVPASPVAQEMSQPVLRAGEGVGSITLDGVLTEPAWAAADSTDAFAQTEPSEGAPPSVRTTVRVLADPTTIVVGIVCEDTDPDGLVSFSVRRDAALDSEDHVRVVLGPYMDGRSGYVFAVNPGGARYDGLINAGAEGDNVEWDGIWEAATARIPDGWSVEIRIPVRTIRFRPGLSEWHFNVQRRAQRLLETVRWASPTRQYQVTQTSRAGLLTDLPAFTLGLGLTMRPALTTGGGRPAPAAPADGELQPSLDITKRLGGNVLLSFTANTDFAETEVDARQTNLTRFPLFFPEKRTFFIEGSDVLAFGPGGALARDAMPYHSRNIGLVNGRAVPILAGGKVNGQAGGTSYSGLVVGTGEAEGVVASRATMAVGRVKQNLWDESWISAIATAGDPLGRSGSWTAGVDFTYGTSRFLDDKNLFVSAWGLAMGRDGHQGDTTSHGFKVDYPNDQWDGNFWYKRVGADFDPSLGFVPRHGELWIAALTNRTRLAGGPIQEMTWNARAALVNNLSGVRESYSVSLGVLNWRFRSGDRVQLNATPVGERLIEPFEVSAGILVPPGSYEWWRRSVSISTAQKRRFYTTFAWEFGQFYGGPLDAFRWSWTWNPTALYTVEFNGERNVGRLPAGPFRQTLAGMRLRINVSPDLSVTKYTQYDTDSDSIGLNAQLRWTFHPAGDVFVVYNHNVHTLLDRWQLESNRFLVKLQYAFRR